MIEIAYNGSDKFSSPFSPFLHNLRLIVYYWAKTNPTFLFCMHHTQETPVKLYNWIDSKRIPQEITEDRPWHVYKHRK